MHRSIREKGGKPIQSNSQVLHQLAPAQNNPRRGSSTNHFVTGAPQVATHARMLSFSHPPPAPQEIPVAARNTSTGIFIGLFRK